MAEPKTTALARNLRKRDTWTEKLLWSWLRDRRFSAYKFRRQHAFGPYILDFFCVEAFLNIELDGLQHLPPDASRLGRKPTARCSMILRFPSPLPSPLGRGRPFRRLIARRSAVFAGR